jgi:hypothetical protein
VSELTRDTWDFFISYAQADRAWAEWIAWVLEENGYRVLIQAWDFVAGANWVRGMQAGTRDAQRTIAVLSSAYLDSVFANAEWQAAWAADPHDRRLLVVRIAECERPGLLGAITEVNLFGLAEPEARECLRAAVSAALTGRAKPAAAPRFPGLSRTVLDEPRFPGESHPSVAGRDADASDGPGLRRRLFTARIPHHSGQLSVAFGAGDTLVVTDKDTTVHRWSLTDSAPLPGAAAGPAPRFSIRRVDIGTQMAASTVTPTVAVSRGERVTLLHFGDGGSLTGTDTVTLGTNEFLIAGGGERFATYDRRGVTVRDFATGSVTWQVAGPRYLAAAAVNCAGDTVAMAGGPNIVAGSNKVVIAAQDSPRLFDFEFENLPVGAGCQLGISPDGQLVACASFREIVVVQPRTGETVHRRKLTGMGEDVRASLGPRPHRLVCSTRGDLLWFRGRRVVDVNWAGERSRYLPQDGLCDSIAFDHATSRLAMAYESGQVDVFQWDFSN